MVQTVVLVLLGGVVLAGLFDSRTRGGSRIPPLGPGRLRVNEVGAALLQSPVSELRRPTITPFDQGFFVWGGTSLDPTIRSPHPIALGGEGGSGVGAMYSVGDWRPMAVSPLSPRAYHASVWTGSELIMAGGSETLEKSALKADVASYSPSSDTWRSLQRLPEPRADALALAVDGKLVIAGGTGPTGSYAGDLYMGTGSDPWTTVSVGHPVYGALVVDGAVVVYGFTGEGTLAFSRVDLSSGTRQALPPLREARFVSSYGVGKSGGSLIAALGGDDQVALYSLREGSQAWDADASFTVTQPLFGVNRFYTSASAGALVVSQDHILSATPRGLYRLSRDGAHRLEGAPVADRCENSVTSALSKNAAIFWVDHTCPRPGVFLIST